MAKKELTKWDLHTYNEITKTTELMREKLNEYCSSKGGVSTGDTIEVEYFRLQELVEYIDNFNDDMLKIIEITVIAGFLSNK